MRIYFIASRPVYDSDLYDTVTPHGNIGMLGGIPQTIYHHRISDHKIKHGMTFPENWKAMLSPETWLTDRKLAWDDHEPAWQVLLGKPPGTRSLPGRTGRFQNAMAASPICKNVMK
jgi:hypothetical protein